MATSRKRRKTALLVLLMGLGLAALVAFRFYQAVESRGSRPSRGPNRTADPQGRTQGLLPRARPVEVAKVERGTVREVVSLVGSLKPKEQVEVIPKITGRVEQVYVDVGDPVQKGQVVAELEGAELEQQVSRAKASLLLAEAVQAQREAELENALAEERRSSRLLEQGLISVQAHQTAETRARVVESQRRVTQAQVQQARAELEELQIRLRQTKIVSPLTGLVGRRYVHPGALVNSNTPVLHVLRLATMVVEVNVPERSLARLYEGSPAIIAVDALGNRSYKGYVSRISPVLDPDTRSGSVEIEIPNRNGDLKAEMFARIRMDLGPEREVLLVPRAAVILRGPQTGVNVLRGDQVQFRPIQTGASTEEGVEVVAGLTENTTVVTRGTQGLKDGDTVMVRDRRAVSRTLEDPS